jgi:hypothetical protein
MAEWWEKRLQDALAAVLRGMSGLRLGPGVLRSIIPIVSVGIIAIAALGYALSSNPYVALTAFVLGLLFLVYVVERSFRYAEKNPLPALFGGAELLELFRDQRSASNKTIVVDAPPEIGATEASASVLEHKGATDV